MLQVKKKAHLYHKLFGRCNSLVIGVHTSLCEKWSHLFLQILMFTLECAYYQQTHLFTAEETEAASEVTLDVFTHSLMKLRCH